MKTKKDYELEILDIIKTKDWNRARASNDKNLYQYIKRHKNTDENCRIIWEHIKTEIRDYKSEVLNIIRTEDWDRAKASNDKNLYDYIRCHKSTDENCRIIWEHISQQRDYKSEVLDIIKTEDWNRAKASNDKNLYIYVRRNRDTDENCRIIWEHIKSRDYKSEIIEIIKTEDWDRAKASNDKKLYWYILFYRDTDENCRIIWEHISENLSYYTIKGYLQYYFKHGKSTKTSNRCFYDWFRVQVNKGNQCCIDVKNLIVAAEDYQDPVALETLDLIKNYLEKEDT